MDRYDPQAIEAKWQAEWEREGAFVVPNPAPDDAPHEHTSTKLLICAEGSITFHVGPDGTPVTLAAGHGFVLPARTRHSAVVGPEGCTCLEGHRP